MNGPGKQLLAGAGFAEHQHRGQTDQHRQSRQGERHIHQHADREQRRGGRLLQISLRRLPVDPITGEAEWGTRSSRDRPDSLFSDGINIFDVYSTSDKKGLNGVPYNEW